MSSDNYKIIAGSRVEDTRLFNRRLVFEAIFQKGPISRVEIGGVVGLKPQTISSITRELLELDLIVEAGRSSGLRGQPQIYLEVNARARFSVGLHLDRGLCRLVICDLKRQEIVRKDIITDTVEPKATLELISATLDALFREHAVPPKQVWGIGLVLPTFGSDVYDFDFSLPYWDQWRDFPVADHLSRLTGCPVLVENDATAAAIGERFHRPDVNSSIFAYIYIGHGTGAGLIIDGMPFKGFRGNSGEVGLLPVYGVDGSPVWPDRQTADILSLRGLASACRLEDEDRLDHDRILELHFLRDHGLMSWMADSASALRDAVAIIEVLFDPEFIAVGGLMPAAVVETLVDRAYPLRPTPSARRDRMRPRLTPAMLIKDAAMLGAAMLPIFVNTNPNFRHLYMSQMPQADTGL